MHERLLGTGSPLPFSPARGEGAWLFDEKGERWLDFATGIALVGHSHPRVVRAIAEQAGKLTAASPSLESPLRARAAERLTALAPENLGKVFFLSTGSEAVENALRIARKWRGRRRIVSFRGNFHGRGYGALSVTGLSPLDRHHKETVPETIFCRRGAIDEVATALTGDAAAVIMEPVQSLAGVRVAERDFVRRVEDLCRARGAALIFDEVATAVGRAGAPFASQVYGVRPHLVATAGGIASGLACAALLVDSGLAETVRAEEYGATFGGNPLAMAALEATLAVLEEGRLWENAHSLGEVAKKRLSRVRGVSGVRGLGLLLGVELEASAARVRDALLAERVLVSTSACEKTIRLLPPLNVGKEEIEKLASALEKVLAARNG